MARHTLRGQVREGEVKRLILDDGILTQGHKVISFVVAGRNPTDPASDCHAVLSLDYDAPSLWEWGDNRQIAWACTQVDQRPLGFSSVIDPDHIVIRDLYIQGQLGTSVGTDVINYLIELEPVTLTDDEAVLHLIKERSQDDLR
jgi:hypothetical protein